MTVFGKLTTFEEIRFRDLLRRLNEEYPSIEAKGRLKERLQTMTAPPECMGTLSELAQEMQSAILRRCIAMPPAQVAKLSRDDVMPFCQEILKLNGEIGGGEEEDAAIT